MTDPVDDTPVPLVTADDAPSLDPLLPQPTSIDDAATDIPT